MYFYKIVAILDYKHFCYFELNLTSKYLNETATKKLLYNSY